MNAVMIALLAVGAPMFAVGINSVSAVNKINSAKPRSTDPRLLAHTVATVVLGAAALVSAWLVLGGSSGTASELHRAERSTLTVQDGPHQGNQLAAWTPSYNKGRLR